MFAYNLAITLTALGLWVEQSLSTRDKMRSRADLNGDSVRMSRAYLRISDHCWVTVRVRVPD